MQPLILTLDRSMQPHCWVSWQNAVTMKCKGLLAHEFGDREFIFHGGTNRMSGRQSLINVGSIIVLKNDVRGVRNRTPPLTNRNLFARDRNVCIFCGKTFADGKLTCEHLMPVSRGGATSWQNCASSCARCNQHKGNRTPQEAHLELMYVPYVPDLAEALVLQNRRILGDQMSFLKDFIPSHSRVHLSNAAL